MNLEITPAVHATLWDPRRSPQSHSTLQSRIRTGIRAVFPVLHTPYYVYEKF
jgi:hypothetical protein